MSRHVIQSRPCHILALAAVALLTVPAGSAGQALPPRFDPAWHGTIAAMAAATSGALAVTGRTAPTCRWCALDDGGHPRVNRLDRWARDRFRWEDEDRARTWSHVMVTTALVLPSLALLDSNDGFKGETGRDQIVVAESALVSFAAADVVKRLLRRPRPRVLFEDDPIVTRDDVHSFFSAHAAAAFGAVTSAWVIASRRGGSDGRWTLVASSTAAAATAYLRVAGDRHYLTDVIAGTGVGIALGAILPQLHDERDAMPRTGGKDVMPDAVRRPVIATVKSRNAVALQLRADARAFIVMGSVNLP